MTNRNDDNRREFLARAGKITATAPAAALLLAASAKSAQAQTRSDIVTTQTDGEV